MRKRRVVVTGMGIVSCFGSDVDQFYEQMLAGKSGVVNLDRFPCENYPTRFAAMVQGFNPEGYVDKKLIRRADRFIQYAMVAGKKALEKGGLYGEALQSIDKGRFGVVIGSGMGGMEEFSQAVLSLEFGGCRKVSPFFIPYVITNMAGALLAIDLGLLGPNYSISTACATSNFSILAAANHIREGVVDLMLCGGTEAPLTPVGLAGFGAMNALSKRNDHPEKASRPWDRGRDGFVMGEGAGVLLLEALDHALKRGAPIFAEYLGGSACCDAYHITNPVENGSGVFRSMQLALEDAQVLPSQVNYISAHATSTLSGDLPEIEGICQLFGPYLDRLSINAPKSLIGHGLGASGGLEAIALIKGIQTGWLHPSINVDDPEEIMKGIDYVPNHKALKDITVALSNSFGFGGHNSTLVFAPYIR